MCTRSVPRVMLSKSYERFLDAKISINTFLWYFKGRTFVFFCCLFWFLVHSNRSRFSIQALSSKLQRRDRMEWWVYQEQLNYLKDNHPLGLIDWSVILRIQRRKKVSDYFVDHTKHVKNSQFHKQNSFYFQNKNKVSFNNRHSETIIRSSRLRNTWE